MKLVKLTDDTTFVMPTEIAEVTASYTSNVITVRMKSGIGYKIMPDYKQPLSERMKVLIEDINGALQ